MGGKAKEKEPAMCRDLSIKTDTQPTMPASTRFETANAIHRHRRNRRRRHRIAARNNFANHDCRCALNSSKNKKVPEKFARAVAIDLRLCSRARQVRDIFL